MDDYVSKPIRRPELLAVLARVRPDQPAAAAPTPAPSLDAIVGVDGEAILDMAGSLEALEKMVEIFFDQIPRFLADLRAAVERADAAALERSAHSLKGSVGMWTEGKVYELAAALEEQAHEGDLTRAREHYVEIEIELSYLEHELAAAISDCAAAS